MKDNMIVTFLKDMNDGNVDGVIISTESKREDIQEIINKVVEENELYTLDDIKQALPKDCMLFDRWFNVGGAVYY